MEYIWQYGGLKMTIDQGLAILGIVLSVVFGVWAAKKIVNRQKTQNQTVGKGGVGIQSGRDTRIEK